MRKNFSFMTKFMALSMAAMVAVACGDKDSNDGTDDGGEPVVPAKVTDASAVAGPGDGEITVQFKAPADTNWQYAEITYYDLDEKKDVTEAVDAKPNDEGFYVIKYTGYTDYETNYNFDIVSVSKPVNSKRAKSEAERVTSKAKEPSAELVATVAETLAIEPCTMGGFLSWAHTTGETIYIRVSYNNPDKNLAGADQVVKFDWEAKTSGSFRVGSMPATGHDLKVWVVTKKDVGGDLEDSQVSEAVTFPAFTPGAATRFQKVTNPANPNDLRDYWTVEASSPSMNMEGGKPVDGEGPRNILHGDYELTAAQRWHSKAPLVASDIPFEGVFDLQEPRIIAKVEHQDAKNSFAAPNAIEFLFCDELDETDPMGASNWVSAGVINHDASTKDLQTSHIQMRKAYQFMKVSCLGTSPNPDAAPGNNYGHIEMGIINFYGETPTVVE